MSKNQKTKNKFLDAISSDPMSTRSSTRTRRVPTDIVMPAPAAATSSIAADPASTLTPPLRPPRKEQQVAATKLKKESYEIDGAHYDVDSFDALAEVFGDVLQWTQFNKTISVEFWKVLEGDPGSICEPPHHCAALLLQSVSPALKQLAERSEAQHKAIASLSKELEKPKTQQIFSLLPKPDHHLCRPHARNVS
ncbi:hypothetical protein B0H17DRAFT_1147948 [Mycena rosella]|uniref:Uncharacterized protein n=1 Tax=Mycena rosella TaxID=1033263 RepID=A0AAD7CJ92_MYCRO|nr:hypothetical protein B0H17DRAFT_1147948 [Mycena rosella]